MPAYVYSVRRRQPKPEHGGKMAILRPEPPTAIVKIPDQAPKPKAPAKPRAKKSDG